MPKIAVRLLLVSTLGSCLLSACGCSKDNKSDDARKKLLAGEIHIDGSSTVYPITDCIAREFQKVQPRIWVRVDLSGSERGLLRLLNGKVEIADASRRITKEELETLASQNIQIIELPVAIDGISIVVNRGNDWVDYLTIDELKEIWKPGSKIKTWKDIRPDWPDRKIDLCAPTLESGTLHYFTETVCGETGSIRQDYFAHEDEHVLGPHVGGHADSLGFCGFGWYLKYKKTIRLVPVKVADSEPVTPNPKNIVAGAYHPLSRPLFIYLNTKSAQKPEVEAFVEFYLRNAKAAVEKAGYVPFEDDVYQKILEAFKNRKANGEAGVSYIGVDLGPLLK